MSLRLPLVVALAGLCLSACDREPHAPAQPRSDASAPAAEQSGDAEAALERVPPTRAEFIAQGTEHFVTDEECCADTDELKESSTANRTGRDATG